MEVMFDFVGVVCVFYGVVFLFLLCIDLEV